jgi:hypothetical protein
LRLICGLFFHERAFAVLRVDNLRGTITCLVVILASFFKVINSISFSIMYLALIWTLLIGSIPILVGLDIANLNTFHFVFRLRDDSHS